MGKKVLIVEDSSTMRSLIADTVKELEGCSVVEAGSGFEALKVLPSHPIDLIITDINMPDINGLEVLNFVKNHPLYKGIPLVIITTEKCEDEKKKGMELGASAYIVKPFKKEEFLKVIKKVLK